MRSKVPCPEWRELLSAYQDHELTPEDNARVLEHLAQCGACRDALAQLEADRIRFTSVYAATTVDVRTDVLEEIRAMSQPQHNIFPTGWLRWLTGLSAVAVLACLVLVPVVVFYVLPQGRERERQIAALTQQRQAQTATEMGAQNDSYGVNGDLVKRDIVGERARQAYAYSPSEVDYSASLKPLDMPTTAPGMPAFTPSSPIVRAPLGKRPKGNFMTHGYVGNGLESNSEQFDYLVSTGRNYGVEGGLRMAYDVDYRLQVKDALKASRQAQQIVRDHAGFIVDYAYGGDEGQLPWATIRGKIPADQAEQAFTQLEKLGSLRALVIGGEDLTQQFQAQLDEIERAAKQAEETEKISHRARPGQAMQAENMRNWAKEQEAQAKRTLLGLRAKHELVEFTAAFTEGKPREPFTLGRLSTGTAAVLSYSLLLLATVAVILLLLGLLIAPWTLLRLLRNRKRGQEAGVAPIRSEVISS